MGTKYPAPKDLTIHRTPDGLTLSYRNSGDPSGILWGLILLAPLVWHLTSTALHGSEDTTSTSIRSYDYSIRSIIFNIFTIAFLAVWALIFVGGSILLLLSGLDAFNVITITVGNRRIEVRRRPFPLYRQVLNTDDIVSIYTKE